MNRLITRQFKKCHYTHVVYPQYKHDFVENKTTFASRYSTDFTVESHELTVL